ncbi:MAG: metalloregulator ArsR/SmtB family transcription factor [Magnetococcus sp. YQC-3]
MLTPEILLKSLVDETRLRCIILLAAEDELCVCEFGYALGEVQPKISRHLAVLREHMLVQDRRDAQWIHYRLHPELPPWALAIIHSIAQGATGLEIYEGDRERLRTIPGRAERCRETEPHRKES